MEISVIICTHNPREDYMRRTLSALQAQTLPYERWELLLIDNASTEPLAGKWDLSWHPRVRHIREADLGLTPARLRGIGESHGQLLIFVDDDCELAVDYLCQASAIGKKHSMLGAWGGQCLPVFEAVPPDWTKPYWGHLTIRVFDQERWSNQCTDERSIPWGAGLCIRKEIADVYRQRVTNDPVLKQLDRRGHTGPIMGCGDLDMALSACDEGLGIGIFPQLKLNHLIPTSRIREEYLLKVVEGHEYSSLLMNERRGRTVGGRPIPMYRRQLGRLKRRWTMERRDRLFFEARLNGQQRALAEIRCHGCVN